MTARLPIPGGDDDTWGNILNSFLSVSLAADGTLNSNVVSTNQLVAGSVTNVQLDNPTQTIINSVASKYVKPAGGIPSSDLTSSAQASLSSANSAVQSVNSKTGTSITLTAGDVSALPTTTKLAGLADTSGAAGASNNQVLSYNSLTNQWVAATVSSSTVSDATTSSKGIIQLAGDLAAGTAAAPEVTSTHLTSALPVNQGGTGSASQNFVDLTTNQTIAGNKTLTGTTATNSLSTTSLQVTGSSPASGKVLTSDSSGNATWAAPSGSSTLAGDTDVSITSPANTQVLTYNSGTGKWQNQAAPTPGNATGSTLGLIQLSGDLSGTATSPTVGKLNGVTISGTPGTSQVLTASSTSAASWSNLPSAPVTSVFSRSGAVTAQSGDYSFSQVGAAQGLTPTAVKTGTYGASAGDFVPVDASGGSGTVNLPTTPADKSRVGVKVINTAGSNTVTINTGGSDVLNKSGGSTSTTLSLLNQSIMLQYNASGGIWYVQSDGLPLSQLDTRYLELSGGKLTGAFTMQPVNLTDGATIAVNAALGNHFRVTLGGNRTLSNPTGATDGQLITFSIAQDGTGGRTLAFDTQYHFGTDITSITLSTGANVTDKIGVQYNQAASHFDVIAFVRGF